MLNRSRLRLRFPVAAAGALALLLGLAALPSPVTPQGTREAPPSFLLLSVDTLRTDRLSAYGYERPTSPSIDRLLERGARFTQARTVQPLTNPALSSMITSRYPHEHGGTRNGLRMRPGLSSLPKLLARSGYRTAAFVGNWTLRDRISGLGEHFEQYEEVLSKRRWFGLFRGEADGADLTDAAVAWLEEHRGSRRPFLLWVHYVDPHAPYVFHRELAERLGISAENPDRSDRYDTEVAFVDQQIGRLLEALEADPQRAAATVILFVADHGESLGEHDYWGHGRNLYEPNLHIPFGIVWPGRIEPQVVEAPALLVDVAPTVLGLLGLASPPSFHGQDWSGTLHGGEPPEVRTTWFQAHRGAVLTKVDAHDARSNGLLEVGLLVGGMKEILEVKGSRTQLYDLTRDPGERADLSDRKGEPSRELAVWYQAVEAGLDRAGAFPPPALDEEAIEKLKALGYTD